MSLCWLVYWYEYNVRTMFVALSVLLDWILQTRKTPIITVIRLTADRETSISWIHWDPIKCPPPLNPLVHHSTIVFRGLRGTLNWAQLCWEVFWTVINLMTLMTRFSNWEKLVFPICFFCWYKDKVICWLPLTKIKSFSAHH